MKSLILASGLITLALLSGCSQSDGKSTSHRHIKAVAPEYDVQGLAGEAKGEVMAFGTLATFGSFEWGTAPLATLTAASLKHVPQLLHDHKLTADEAQGMVNAAVKARDLLKAANAACAQNDHTGKCTGDQTQAEALADQAKAAIVSGCLSPSDQEILKCLRH